VWRTDGQTDGRTDRITITKTVHRIASHGKNYKTVFFDFWFRPTKVQNLLPKICIKSPISRLVWQIDRRCLGLLGGFIPCTKRCSSIFYLGPLTPKFTLQNLHVGHWVSHSLWVMVCGSTNFGLGAESSRLPACLFSFLFSPPNLRGRSVNRHHQHQYVAKFGDDWHQTYLHIYIRFMKFYQKFGTILSKNIGGPKAPKFRLFFDFIANISRMKQYNLNVYLI